MASLTLRGIVDAVAALDIVGVKKVYSEPPVNSSTTETPAIWPELPVLERNETLFSCDKLNTAVSISFVVAIAPYGQKTQPVRFDEAVDMADKVKAALDLWTTPGDASFFSNFLQIELAITTEIQTMTANYWGVRAFITARES